MQVVGIDLGTTNIRISLRDSDEPGQIPVPQIIGEADSLVMPAVIAFQLQGGGVETFVGEDADRLTDSEQTVVIRNFKRWALSHDSYVGQRLVARSIPCPDWWDGETYCVRVLGEVFSVKEVLSRMLKKALQTAGVRPGFEWAAGCPVHTGLRYRAELAQAIIGLGGVEQGGINRIVEEPIMPLSLAYRRGILEPGSYLVYDLGGGSFDCALAQISRDESGDEMTVYGAHGDPVLGGSDIDEYLKEILDYQGPPKSLREAKEAVSPANSSVPLLSGEDGQTSSDQILTWHHIEEAVKKLLFVFKTTVTMRDSYRDARIVWHRDDPEAPVGEVARRNTETGEVQFVWELGWVDMAEELDGIILCGGPTKFPLFEEELKRRFGEEKIIPISKLLRGEIPDPELTAISAGACYAADSQYKPLYVNRLPVQIILEDLATGGSEGQVSYEPYQHFDPYPRQGYQDFVSEHSLSENLDDPHSEWRYKLTVTTPDGVVMDELLVDTYINNRLMGSSLRLIINRLGQVGVEQASIYSPTKKYEVIKNPPWQTETQRRAFEQIQENIRLQQEREKERLNRILYSNPWGWQEHSG